MRCKKDFRAVTEVGGVDEEGRCELEKSFEARQIDVDTEKTPASRSFALAPK